MAEVDDWLAEAGPVSPLLLHLDADRTTSDVRIVTVRGELDIATCGQLVRCVEEQLAGGPQRLVLDLGGVTFLDARGIGTLVTISAHCEGRGIPVHLVGRSNTSVVRPLDLIGLTGVLDPRPSAAQLLDTVEP